MSASEQKRQKKLAKQKKKRKEKITHITHNKNAFIDSLKSFEQASKYPIHECYVTENMFEIGMGTVFISRKITATTFAVSIFLLDTYFYGVKNAFNVMASYQSYSKRLFDLKENQPMIIAEPSYVRKLIEDSIAYAKNLGVNPHADYAEAKYILGDIDASECTTTFEFGNDGRPLLISGPPDDFDEDDFFFGDGELEDDEDEK